MELFSELYSRKYLMVSTLLKELAKGGIKAGEASALLDYNSGLTLSSLENDLKLIKRENGLVYAAPELNTALHLPLTKLELSWLRSICDDERIGLFLNENELKQLKSLLADTEPLYNNDCFYAFDKEHCQDDYRNEAYIKVFRTLLEALLFSERCLFTFDGETIDVQPYYLVYSMLNGGFLLFAYDESTQRIRQLPLRLITAVKPNGKADRSASVKGSETESVTVEIFDHADKTVSRNAVERFMISFSNFRKESSFDTERQICRTTVYYQTEDSENVLQGLLSFGATVKVISPPKTIREIVTRLRRQKQLLR